MTTGWDRARAIADAVLYEGYLLYPYRASSRKNQCRWQFGVLGPPGAADAGIGEERALDTQFLVAGRRRRSRWSCGSCSCSTGRPNAEHGDGGFAGRRTRTPAGRWLSGTRPSSARSPSARWIWPTLDGRWTLPLAVPGGSRQSRTVDGGRLVRTRRELRGAVTVDLDRDDGLDRVSLTVVNTTTARRRYGRGHRQLDDRHPCHRRDLRRPIRLAARTATEARRRGGTLPAQPLLSGAGRCAG